MLDFVQDFPESAHEGVPLELSGDPNSRLKRSFDIVFAAVMLVALSPLFLLLALSVMVVDGGNPFYAHLRIGRDGRAFRCLKFRSMVRDADVALDRLLERSPEARREWQATQKLKEDPRILPVIGTVLRKSSLDELPQFFNVLVGDMSIVGPRPIVAEELDRYGPYKRYYLAVRPGLTGPWQAGNRSDDSYEVRVKKDVAYVQRRDMLLDLRIIAKTARIFLSGRAPGAY